MKLKKRRIQEGSWLISQPLAHRGFHNTKSPENSISSFENAKTMGYGIELDVHLTKDEHLIVFHDNNTKRMTGANINTYDLTLSKLEKLRLLNTDEKIPLFKEVLQVVDSKVPILIEMKNTSEVGKIEEKLLEELKDYKGEYAVQAFNPFRIIWLKNNAPHIIRGQLSGIYENKNSSKISKCIRRNLLFNIISKPDFVNYEIEGLNKFVIKFLRYRGFPVISWTAKNYSDYCKALKLCDNVVFENFTVWDKNHKEKNIIN